MNFLPDQTDSSFVLASFLPWGFSAVVRSVIISKQYLVADIPIIIPDIGNNKSVTEIFKIYDCIWLQCDSGGRGFKKSLKFRIFYIKLEVAAGKRYRKNRQDVSGVR